MNKALERIKNNPLIKTIGVSRIVLLAVVFLLIGIFSILSPLLNQGVVFLDANRLMSALNYYYFIGFLALGVTFVIATGGIDFSIGSVMFCSALISGYCLTRYGFPLWLCILISVGVGAVFGTAGGFLVAYIRLPSFITSMALMLVAKGAGSIFTMTQSVSWPKLSDGKDAWFRYFITYQGFPTGLVILLVFAALASIFLFKTKPGRYIVCLGSNREAVRLSGVDVRKWEMLAFIISGIFAGVAAIFYVGAYTTVQPGMGDIFNNEAIAACVMGGTSMAGGSASIFGTVIGAFVIAMVQEGILSMGFNINYQYVLTGLILFTAVSADTISRRRRT